ncbi:MAG TPA: pectinesterase family protein, partial [Spirochaetia bacterium]|nr:pectinesterase family protein [Spirochaetia bacterium]
RGMEKPRLVVGKGSKAGFRTVQAAVDAAPESGGAVIAIGPGEYREKLFVGKPGLRLEGAGRDRTVLRWDDAAEKPFGDGTKTGTFRSYAAYFGGDDFEAADLSVVNGAGRGPGVGQAIAAYVDSRRARFSRCAFRGRQDTLFLGPLPPRPRVPGSFVGPGESGPRILKAHRFEDCLVEGDVDFIFGSAAALFLRCEIRSLRLPPGMKGYVTASSSPEGAALGLCFLDCGLSGDAEPGSVFLGRPWRPHAQAAFLYCSLGAHIAPRGWSDWEEPSDRGSVGFVEGGSAGPGAGTDSRAAWASVLGESETEAFARSLLASFGA